MSKVEVLVGYERQWISTNNDIYWWKIETGDNPTRYGIPRLVGVIELPFAYIHKVELHPHKHEDWKIPLMGMFHNDDDIFQVMS